jgi:hypothetical protein
MEVRKNEGVQIRLDHLLDHLLRDPIVDRRPPRDLPQWYRTVSVLFGSKLLLGASSQWIAVVWIGPSALKGAPFSNEGAMRQPDPSVRFPIPGDPRTVFLKNVVSAAFIEVGDFTYYHDPDGPERFEDRCVFQHFAPMGDRLVIGKFCALATGVRFFMSGAMLCWRPCATPMFAPCYL